MLDTRMAVQTHDAVDLLVVDHAQIKKHQPDALHP
jgi:hypothetical protein